MSNLQKAMDEIDQVAIKLNVEKTLKTSLLEEKFIELAEKKELLKKQLKDLEPELEQTMQLLGLEHSFQGTNGLVYKITKPNGTFISFKQIDYVRTKKEGEAKGSLSKSEAKELGFKVD